MSSRERMLAALSLKEPDYVPCSFMIFTALRERCSDEFDFIQRQLELGLDARVNLPDLPIRFGPEVSIKEWKEHPPGKRKNKSRKHERDRSTKKEQIKSKCSFPCFSGIPCFRDSEERPLLYKEYHTSAGTLSAVVRQTEDWPYGDHIPLFDDYLAPRSLKFLITEPKDLPALRRLLAPPLDEDIKNFQEKAKRAKKFAEDKGLLLAGGWSSGSITEDTAAIGSDPGTMGIDALMWLSGPVNPLYWAYDQPEFLKELIEIIALWNRRRMEIILDVGVDLIIKRAWYEGCDFWSPTLYRKFIAPVLKEDIELTHQAGSKFGYIITSGMMPLLDDFLKLGIDVIIGIDPVQGKGTDMRILKERLGGKICLWGGVNGFITIERGRPEEIREAVKEAIKILAPGGFILSPVDNVRDTSEATWQNVLAFISAWKEFRNSS